LKPVFPPEDDAMIGTHSFVGINPWAVLACAIATMVIGFLWYSPILFANPWMRLMGFDPNDKAKLAELQKGAGKLYGLSFAASIVSAVVLAKIIDITSVNTISYGMKIGFAVWLGFVTTVQLTAALFGKQPTKLYLINTGYQLICYLTMGAILAKW
jgi:surface polysaccharide O-acyltransferase-like enzyme